MLESTHGHAGDASATVPYLAQTVFGVMLFYGRGFGMLGKLGAAFFVLQVLLAQA